MIWGTRNIEVPSEIVRDFSRLAGLLELADKEFQEIRQKISKYKLEVSEKIQSDEKDEEIMLDAVSLQILLDTDKGYISLNREIADCTGYEIDTDMAYNQETLYCKWLGITTVGDVKLMLEQKKDVAVGLAKKFLENYEGDKILSKTIGLFYLCYAKLVTEYPKQKWADYLRESHIGRPKDTAEVVERLSKVYQEIRKEKEQNSTAPS